MLITLSQTRNWTRANAVWLASLGAAALINALFVALATLAPMGNLPRAQPQTNATPLEIVRRIRPPPPPDLTASQAEAPPTILPPRFRPRPLPAINAASNPAASTLPLRLRLNLNSCEAAGPHDPPAPDCKTSAEWLRADRDASDLLGPAAQGYTLDEVAAARGWIKPKPRGGQDAMAATTDATLPETIFKDAPFPPDAIERAAGQ
jgi:hypothetical protein